MPSKPITKRRETTVVQRSAVWTWYMAGKRISEIGSLENLPRTTVASIIERTKKRTGIDRFTSAPRSGAPIKVTLKAERRLMRAAFNDTRAPLVALATPSKSGQQLHRNTVRKILKRNGKARRKPCRKPYLKPEHM